MFEGKEIIFYCEPGNIYTGVVVSCIKDIGISIVDKENKNLYLYCLKMKNAPNFWNEKGQITYTRKLFTEVRKAIIAEELDINKIYKKLNVLESGYSSAESCPFGQ